MTPENLIIELINVAGLPGVMLLAIAGVLLLRSRSVMLQASASSVEASVQASIAKDNAEIVRNLANQNEQDKTLLMEHVLKGQDQVVALTQLIGEVRLELSDRINLVTVENAKLATEVELRRESDAFLKKGVMHGLQSIEARLKELVDERKQEVSTDKGTVPSSRSEDSKPQSDNHIGGTHKGITEIGPSGGRTASG